MVKNPPANAGDVTDAGSILGQEDSPGGGNGNPLQYSCLENLTDRGAWRATDHGFTKEPDTTERAHTHSMIQGLPYSARPHLNGLYLQ